MMGVKLFGRMKDEILKLRVEDLPQDYFVVTPEDVLALCAVLDGKADLGPVHLAMWDEYVCPEFSPMRILLI
jgi:hypothetical protein